MVRSSNAASSMISFNKSHGGGMNSSMIKPQASNLTDAEIYSVSFNQTDFYAMFNASKAPSPRHGYSKSYGGAGSGRGGDVYSLQSSIGVAPRGSSFNEEVFKTKEGGRSMGGMSFVFAICFYKKLVSSYKPKMYRILNIQQQIYRKE